MAQAGRIAAVQAVQEAPRPPCMLRVPLFSDLAARLMRDGRRAILDLGPARSGLVTFCSAAGCRIDIADIAPTLPSLNAEKDGLELLALAEHVLPRRSPRPVDVVLCWDLLNYLERRPLAALMERIAKRAARGALVHALIVYSAPRMPASPHNWFPVFPGSLQTATPGARRQSGTPEIGLNAVPSGEGERAAPRYTPDDLRRCLPAYTIDRGVLLGNGMQEFLFRV